MKKKVKRFQEGGFSKEQEEWLGGADRTDPYILARMRKAVPDKPMANDDSPAGKTGYGEQNELPEVEATKSVTKPKAPVRTASTRTAPAKTEVAKEVVVEKTKEEPKKSAGAEPSFLRGTKGYNLSDITNKIKGMLPEGSDRRTEKQKAAGEEPSFLRGTKGYNLSDIKMKAGGKVSSASKRADGCAVRGKTRA
jgi:hypothetical protein